MTTYDASFYSKIASGAQLSAALMVPAIVDRFQPERVLDVGCGQGWWAKTFEDFGCEAFGIDGAYVTDRVIENFVERDLETQRLPSDGPFDLVVCLEVGEHLSESRSAELVEDLTSLASVVVFSAAIPGQTGAGHINCQWPQYWVDLFASHGFTANDELRWQFWDDARIEPWYRQNIFVATNLAGVADTGVAPVVHPDIWAWKL